MTHETTSAPRNSSPYTAAFTREQFLFYETRATARLICEGLSEEEAVNRIMEENLFQYPTEKSVGRMARACVRLQEQDDSAASWSDSTVGKLKQVLTKILFENEYIDNTKAGRLNPVWLNPILENAIRGSHDDRALAAFNYFS